MNKLKLMVMMLSLISFGGCESKKAPASSPNTAALEKKIAELEAKMNVVYEKLNLNPVDLPLGHSYYQGAKNPILTIVEFSDFECPYCARVSPILDALAKEYPNKIRIVFKHFPLSFHKNAKAGHAAALAAGAQGKFYEYRYKLGQQFKNLNDETFIKVATEIGLDINKFKKDMVLDAEDEKKINADIALGQKVGVRGTPTLYANGLPVEDRSFQGLVKLLKKLGG